MLATDTKKQKIEPDPIFLNDSRKFRTRISDSVCKDLSVIARGVTPLEGLVY